MKQTKKELKQASKTLKKHEKQQKKLQKKQLKNQHVRVNQSLLGPLERPALQWLAERAPSWVNPDMLTVLGLIGSLVIFAGYLLSRIDLRFIWLSNLGFVINWFGDSLDGTLARHRHIERPRFGYFIDHTVDAVSEALIFIGLGLSPFVTLNLALFALIGYMMVSVYVYVNTYVSGEFRISYAKLGPTEIRLIGIIANILMLVIGVRKFTLPIGNFTFYDLVMIALCALFYIGFFVIVLLKARQLSNEDIAARNSKE